MASEFAKFVSSDVVELLAQRGESRFLVHKDILTRQSKPFQAALSGEWKESTECKVDLGDWDGATVARMVEFLYLGTYRYPDAIPLSSELIQPVQAIEVVLKEASDESKSITTRPLTPVNECLRNLLPVPVQKDETAVERLERFDPATCNYGEALLAHAKVYHLAHYKAILPLQMLALQHLLDTLSRIDPIDTTGGSHNVENIVDLARYVYQNTEHLENKGEPLQKLVSHFIGSNFLALNSTSHLAQLLSEGGDIVMHVMQNIYRGPPQPPIRSNSGKRAPALYVSRLCVTSGEAPPDHLLELNGVDAKIKSGPGTSPVWLYLEYTLIPDDACTKFTTLVDDKSDRSDAVLIGPGRHILFTSEPGVQQKITAVSLLRGRASVTVSTIPAKYGTFDGMTADINGSWYSDYLYIVWKSVLVT